MGDLDGCSNYITAFTDIHQLSPNCLLFPALLYYRLLVVFIIYIAFGVCVFILTPALAMKIPQSAALFTTRGSGSSPDHSHTVLQNG